MQYKNIQYVGEISLNFTCNTVLNWVYASVCVCVDLCILVFKDGAFVVRDSTKGFAEHPYTLMLLKQGKVYNIKIRNQGNSYSLGTGVNNTKVN